jgi:hypothetical protein
MDPLTYLTTFSTDFGALEWVFFIAQIAVGGAGVYLAFLRGDTHPVRAAANRQLGIALLAVGGLGALFGALRLAGVQVFTMPIWFTIVTVLEAILAIYAIYYVTSVLPARLAAYEEANRSRGVRRGTRPQPALQANGLNGAAFSETRAPATSTRRDSRRDRKRKSR